MNSIDLSQLTAWSETLVGTAFGPLQILLSLTITFLMAMFIYLMYRRTYNGVLYSKNFNLTLVMLALATNAIIIGISGNIILSLGMVGALSIVRFRTAVKDPRDTAFIFWAITVGVVNGVAYYELSFIASAFIAIVLAFLARSAVYEPAYMLIMKYSAGSYKSIEPLLKAGFSRYFIRSDTNKGGTVEKVVEVRVKKNDDKDKILEQIRAVSGVESCVLLASNGEFAE